jgi:hypothetical protein
MSSIDVTAAEHKTHRLGELLTSLSTPAGLAALSVISLILGAAIQDIRSQRDLNRAWLQERSKHQMAARKAFLDEQTVAVEQVYEAVSNIRETSISLLDLTRPEFENTNLHGPISRRSVEVQRQRVRKSFNTALDKWEHTRFLSEYRLNAYAGDDAALQKPWSETRAAAAALADCASESYLKVANGTARYSPKTCAQEASMLDNKWSQLSASLRASRRAAWHDWENPPLLFR